MSDLFSIKTKERFTEYSLALLFVKHMSDHYKVEKKFNFENIVKLRGNPYIGLELNMILSKLAEDNNLQGILEGVDFTDTDRLGDGEECVDNISKIITSINE